jgi:hypothetical protein
MPLIGDLGWVANMVGATTGISASSRLWMEGVEEEEEGDKDG